MLLPETVWNRWAEPLLLWKQSISHSLLRLGNYRNAAPPNSAVANGLVEVTCGHHCGQLLRFTYSHFSPIINPVQVQGGKSAGSRRETFHSWQRSWGRGLGILKGGIEPRECPWIFSSIYPPKNQSLPTLLLCAFTSDFTGGCPPPPSHSLCQRVNLQLQLIKFLGN